MALAIAALPFVCLDTPAALAQAMMMRTPSVNIPSRTPTINPTVTPRVDPTVTPRLDTSIAARNPVDNHHRAGRPTNIPSITPRTTGRINPNSTMPYARFSPNLYPTCEAANRDSNGECIGKPADSGGGKGGGGKIGQEGQGRRRRLQLGPGRRQSAPCPQATGRRDRRRIDRRAGRRAGAASRTGADRIAEFSADRRHHRPVPYHR